jgi:serine/threonine-protein phosphatase CPPED1
VIKINELKPDFAIICGDVVHHTADSSYSDFLKIMKGFNMPCYVACGNHDIGNLPDSSALSFYRRIMGKEYYEFQHKGYAFVVTNTQLWKHTIGEESEKHEHWFKDALREQHKKKRPVFVIGHIPLYIEQPDEDGQYFNIPPVKRQEILALFIKNNVVAYLSGHAHKLVANQYEQVQLVSGETTSKNFDQRPFGFRLWHVAADAIKHYFVALPDSSSIGK